MILVGKHIELEITKTHNDRVKFKIKKQTENLRARRGILTEYDTSLEDIQYCNIISESVPEAAESLNCFFIRGVYPEKDNIILKTTKSFFDKIERTLENKINEKIKCIY